MGEGVVSSLPSSEPPQIEALVGALIMNFATDPREEWAVVLDDHDLINSESVHGVAPFLLERLLDGAHLIASRVDLPLSLSRRRATVNGSTLDEPMSRRGRV